MLKRIISKHSLLNKAVKREQHPVSKCVSHVLSQKQGEGLSEINTAYCNKSGKQAQLTSPMTTAASEGRGW